VRPPAEVFPRPLAINRDGLALGQILNDLRLVGFADALEVGDGFVAVPDLALDLLIAVNDFAHLGFDLGQIVQGEGFGAGEVVIEAVLDGGADGHLRAGEELLHGFRHHVAGVVADRLQHVRIVPRQDFDAAVPRQRAVEVQHLAVEADQRRLLGQGFGQALGDLAARHPLGIVAQGAVGKLQLHGLKSFESRRAARDRSPIRRRDDSGTPCEQRESRRARARAGSAPPPRTPNKSADSGTGARSRAKASVCRRGSRP
jgi:hypothetical protein